VTASAWSALTICLSSGMRPAYSAVAGIADCEQAAVVR
jgi:hypothetical protein